MATARTTKAGAYVEEAPDQLARVTKAGAYVERRASFKVMTTAAGAYIEFEAPFPSSDVDYSQRMRHGKRFADQVLQAYAG